VRHAGIEAAYIPTDFDFRNYGPFPAWEFIAAQLDIMLDRVQGGMECALDGDVPLLADERWSHLGILAHKGAVLTLIHTTRTERFCREHRVDDEWRRRARGVWRFRGLI
jgi:hypothetical protein